jgi:tetratricopeptide (TPR) repeat protein
MNNLAFIAINEGQFELARDLLSDAVPAEERTLGPDHPQHAGTLQNLGRALLNLGDYEAAEARFVQALAIRVAKLPRTDPRAVKNRDYLIRTLTAQHEFEAAQIVLNEALAPFEKLDERMKAERDLAAAACELYEDWGRTEQLMHWQALRPVRE